MSLLTGIITRSYSPLGPIAPVKRPVPHRLPARVDEELEGGA